MHGGKKEQQEPFDENLGSNKNLSLIHQQYNTDQISGGVSSSKPKKKKKKKHKNVNKTAVDQQNNGLNQSDNFADPGGNYQKGTFSTQNSSFIKFYVDYKCNKYL
jgi:hypothetical protein